jgi:hypothetical protein
MGLQLTARFSNLYIRSHSQHYKVLRLTRTIKVCDESNISLGWSVSTFQLMSAVRSHSSAVWRGDIRSPKHCYSRNFFPLNCEQNRYKWSFAHSKHADTSISSSANGLSIGAGQHGYPTPSSNMWECHNPEHYFSHLGATGH